MLLKQQILSFVSSSSLDKSLSSGKTKINNQQSINKHAIAAKD
jgi:hypothetical protein